ncbi:hypothetical protein BEWA_029710 [Theileria equi strain WA]|uniref:Signal peptide containing protein n=1 Tax=Theileria equi strain WA TaxID=1537102 RepID=L0AX32_THEEQ|nr:hypothetical protein BEWA_029710 [Theileria equi strain WA]AFZ80120.1 hypothetical protein BEWA_029710 [Theileria equi strain WA]|eukprot:XP_004829786.1 hypothetical protein BEWA_029710 [Theileria equi strain WA]
MEISAIIYTLLLIGVCDCGSRGVETSQPKEQVAAKDSRLGCTLDLSSPDISKINIRERFIGGAEHKSHTASANHRIALIIDSGTKIWEASGEEECEYATTSMNGDVILLTLGLAGCSEKAKFFEKIDGSWIQIEEQAFLDKSKKIRESRPSVSVQASPKAKKERVQEGGPEPVEQAESGEQANADEAPESQVDFGTKEPFTLDISDPDRSKVIVKNSTDRGVDKRSFTPKVGQYISAIAEGGFSIWSAFGDEECNYVTLSFKDDAALLAIDVQSGGQFISKGFEKIGNAWKSITQEEFQSKINALLDYEPASESPIPEIYY